MPPRRAGFRSGWSGELATTVRSSWQQGFALNLFNTARLIVLILMGVACQITGMCLTRAATAATSATVFVGLRLSLH
jgi:hypothetical protein